MNSAVSIRLPVEIFERLQAVARHTGRSKTSLMLEAIQEHLNDLEDIALAEQRLADHRAGRSKSYSLDEVERELGLAN